MVRNSGIPNLDFNFYVGTHLSGTGEYPVSEIDGKIHVGRREPGTQLPVARKCSTSQLSECTLEFDSCAYIQI